MARNPQINSAFLTGLAGWGKAALVPMGLLIAGGIFVAWLWKKANTSLVNAAGQAPGPLGKDGLPVKPQSGGAPPSGQAGQGGTVYSESTAPRVLRATAGQRGSVWGWTLDTSDGRTYFLEVIETNDSSGQQWARGSYGALKAYQARYGDLKPGKPIDGYEGGGWSPVRVN